MMKHQPIAHRFSLLRHASRLVGLGATVFLLPPVVLSQDMDTTPPADSTAVPASDLEAELASVQVEFTLVREQLEAVHQQAVQREDVQEAQKQMRTAMRDAMLEEAPDQREVIERFFDLRAQVTDPAEAPADPQAVITQLESVQQQLAPVLEEAADAEEVREARDAYREAVVTAMKAINPQTDQLFQTQRELYNRYQQLLQRANGGGGATGS
jgi:uncharacterized coiled-coil DUF342 family protein